MDAAELRGTDDPDNCVNSTFVELRGSGRDVEVQKVSAVSEVRTTPYKNQPSLRGIVNVTKCTLSSSCSCLPGQVAMTRPQRHR